MHAKDWLTMHAFLEPSNGHMSSYPDATVAHLDDNRAVDTQDIRGAEHAQANTDLETTGLSTPTVSLMEYRHVHETDEAVVSR